MAYVKVSRSNNATAALRYGEHEKGVIRGGVDCPEDTETARRLFTADRIMWNKDSGVQAHVIIQSFDGRECSPEEANKIGQELARAVAPGHRAMVYTHQESEGGNIHNHVVVCSVNHENGKKLDGHGLLYKARHHSDELCKEHELSIIRERKAELRYTMAEKSIVEKGGISWKDNIREVVEAAKNNCRNLEEFKEHLKQNGITIHERGSSKEKGGKQWTYYAEHEGKQVRVRAAKLGEAYSRDSVSKAVSLEKVSALEKVQEMQQAGKSALDKANQLINGKVQQEQERQRAAELARQKAAEQQRAMEKPLTKTLEKTPTFELGR